MRPAQLEPGDPIIQQASEHNKVLLALSIIICDQLVKTFEVRYGALQSTVKFNVFHVLIQHRTCACTRYLNFFGFTLVQPSLLSFPMFSNPIFLTRIRWPVLINFPYTLVQHQNGIVSDRENSFYPRWRISEMFSSVLVDVQCDFPPQACSWFPRRSTSRDARCAPPLLLMPPATVQRSLRHGI
jgi:hypothetical protein